MDTSMPFSSAQTIKKPFPILDLPPEIRRIVLRMMLVPPRMLDSYSVKYDKPKTGHVAWKVLLTCKQLYEEGRRLLYGQNIFHLIRGGDISSLTPVFTAILWPSLNSAAEENLAMIQRVAIDLDTREAYPVCSELTQFIRLLYNPAPELRAFRPFELIVTNLDLSWLKPEDEEYFVNSENEKARLKAIMLNKEYQGRTLQERCAFDERTSKISFHIHALKLRDTILATLAELQKLDTALMHVHVASALGNPDEFNGRWILIFSSTKRAPYHLSSAFSTLVSHLHREGH